MWPSLRKILHPTDFSEPSQRAFQCACSLARDQNARLIVAHVIPPPVSHGEVVARRQDNAWREELWSALRHLRPDPPIPVEYRLEDGEPPAEIVRLATEAGCDLIVMGTHGRTGLRRMVLGSVAEAVLEKAPCTVMTLRNYCSESSSESRNVAAARHG